MELGRTLDRWDRGVRAGLAELEGGDRGASVKRLEDLASRMSPDGATDRRLRERVRDEIDLCRTAAQHILLEVEAERHDKSSFEDLRDWLRPKMAGYNEHRLDLGDRLARDVERGIRRALKGSDVDVPVPVLAASNLVAIPEETVLAVLNKVIAHWPGRIKRFLNFLNNGLEWHGIKEGNRVRDVAMTAEKCRAITTECDRLERSLLAQVAKAIASAHNAVQSRLVVAKGTAHERDEALADLDRKRDDLRHWAPRVRRMQARIERLAVDASSD